MRGETSGIVGKNRDTREFERLLEGCSGEGEVKSLMIIDLLAPGDDEAFVNPTALVFPRGSCNVFGVAGGGSIGLGNGDECACAASIGEERFWR